MWLFTHDSPFSKAAMNCIDVTGQGNRSSVDRVIYSSIEARDTSTSVVVDITFVDALLPPPNMYLMVGRPLKPSLIKGYYKPNYVKQLANMTWDAGSYCNQWTFFKVLVLSSLGLTLMMKYWPWSTDQELYTYTLAFENETAGPIHVGIFELNDGLTVDSVVNRSNWDNLNTFFRSERLFYKIREVPQR